MSAEPERFFLLIAAVSRFGDAVSDKLKTAGIPVRRKSFYSGQDNWESIALVLTDPKLIGAIVKLTPRIYNLIAAREDTAQRIFRALGAVPHIVFVHESILSGKEDLPELPVEDDEYDPDDPHSGQYVRDWWLEKFRVPAPETRMTVSRLLAECNINVVPYQTNAEMSVLSMAFIDDNERNLLFRVYVPSGRLYAAEADKLLSLFRDWLSRVGKHSIRQDGYKTAAGQVYEFFGDESLQRQEISREFDVFSRFLTACVEDPQAAAITLSGAGLNRRSAEAMVARYGKEVRRLQLDIRQERESRLLAIRHSLESELLDAGIEVLPPWTEINTIVDSLVPGEEDLAPMQLLTLPPAASTAAVTLNVNQQFINAVESTVVQNIQGTTNLGPSARELLDLVNRFGGAEKAALESAVHEFEDADARPANRLAARQKLKAFLIHLGGKIEDVALLALEKYLETKVLGK